MLIVGLQNCPGCQIFHEKHPELPFVEIPRRIDTYTKDLMPIKRALGRLQVTEFPVILNDTLTHVIPIEQIDKEFAEAMKDEEH